MTKRLLVAAVGLLLSVPVAASSAAPKSSLDQGVVNINTTLGYQQSEAAGTGMVLTAAGEVLTNNHVIRGATAIRVVVPSTGKSYSATVVGYSVNQDVAVLQMKGASGLQTITAGNSATLKVGQTVTAVGNAGGVGGTPRATTGTITGLGKTITASDDSGGSERLTGLIETDARLQPGDSGGALLNAAGQVIGMNTAASSSFSFRYSATDGFAIPVDKALTLARQIVAGRSSTAVHIGATPFLGVSIRNPGYYPGSYPGDFASTSGVLVTDVVTPSAASRAGISAGDSIVAVAGRAVNTPAELTSRLLRYAPGAKVKVGLVDAYGQRTTTTVTLGSGPPQ